MKDLSSNHVEWSGKRREILRIRSRLIVSAILLLVVTAVVVIILIS